MGKSNKCEMRVTKAGRFVSYLPLPEGCWEWRGSANRQGYGWFRDGKKNARANRAAFELLVGPIPPGMDVLHHCDNPRCVNPHHLFLGTDKDNAVDREAKGRGKPWNATLEAKRKAILLAYYKGDRSFKDIAVEFGVDPSTVSRTVRRSLGGSK